MHPIYLGYSPTLDAPGFFEYLDIDNDHPDGRSRFEAYFDCGYIRPGSFECYAREDYQDI